MYKGCVLSQKLKKSVLEVLKGFFVKTLFRKTSFNTVKSVSKNKQIQSIERQIFGKQIVKPFKK